MFLSIKRGMISSTALSMALLAMNAHADVTQDDRNKAVNEKIMVIGHADKVEDITGSAQYIGKEQLDKNNYTDVNRVLRQIPGVNLQEEEGYGNRPNIGLRGGRSERSADITLMEDGVLIAPAPYASPSAYYFPRIARMEAVEVRKGSSTIKFGPRTTSGAVNLISSSIPNSLSGEAEIAYGEDNTQKLKLNAGDTKGNWGYVVDLLHEGTDGFKKLDNGGDTGYSIQDGMFKLRYNTDPSASMYQSVELKVGATEEDSDETYLGLSESDFNADPYRRYAASHLDNMEASHRGYQLRHYIEGDSGLNLTSTAYFNDFSRNWYKLQSVNDGSTSLGLSSALESETHLAALRGEGDADDTFNLRANDRDYESYGVQFNVGKELQIKGIDNKIEVGIRYHEDEEDRFQQEDTYSMVNGQLQLVSAGDPGSNANRIGSAKATAIYIQDEIKTGNWTFVPGVRYEHIKLKREDYGTSDPTRSGANLNVYENTVDAIVPGVGFGYELNENVSFLGGIHKGFAPPSTPSSSTVEAEEEESINYEAGVRANYLGVKTELIGFFNDYENLLGEETLSSGDGSGSGDQFNGGEVDVYGLELSVSYDLAPAGRVLLNAPKLADYKLPVSFGYTYTKAEFQNSFSSSFDEWGDVTSGDELPYIPNHQLYVSAGIEADKWQAHIAGKYIDEMRTTAGSGDIPSGEGTDEHFVVDIAGDYEVYKNTRLYLTVDNVFDEEYVAATRPAGARPGKPRTFLAGLKVSF